MKKILFFASFFITLFFTVLKPSSVYALEPGDIITDNPGALGSIVIVISVDSNGVANVAPYEPPDPSNPCYAAGTCYSGASPFLPQKPVCTGGIATNITYGAPDLCGSPETGYDQGIDSGSATCSDGTFVTYLGGNCDISFVVPALNAKCANHGVCPTPVPTCPQGEQLTQTQSNGQVFLTCLMPIVPTPTPTQVPTPTRVPTPTPGGPLSCTAPPANSPPGSYNVTAFGGGGPGTYSWAVNPNGAGYVAVGGGSNGILSWDATSASGIYSFRVTSGASTATCSTTILAPTPPPIGSTPTPTPAVPTPTPNGLVSFNCTSWGHVYIDTDRNTCSTTLHPLSNAKVTLIGYTGGTVGSNFTDGAGAYILMTTGQAPPANLPTICGTQYLVISNNALLGTRFAVGAPSVTSGPFTPPNPPISIGTTVGPYSAYSSGATVDMCVQGSAPWFQTTTGDVRFSSFSDPIPGTAVVSPVVATDPNYPGLPISSLTSLASPALGTGTSSSKGWQVGQEYDYANTSSTLLGGMSYSFYKSQAKKKNITPIMKTSPLDLTGLASGVYEVPDNTITYASGQITGGKHIVLLGDGEVTIGSGVNRTILVPGPNSTPPDSGNLFILAAHGDIHISSGVGTLSQNDLTRQLEGYYTSEGSIYLDSFANCSIGLSDLRLDVGGALIANSLHPFAINQGGIVKYNSRTLCSADSSYPVLKIYPRPDFITQMTDFYKISNKTFQEVAP